MISGLMRTTLFGFYVSFAARGVDDCEALMDIDLRRSQAETVRGIHRFEHVLDQLMQFGRIELSDGG